MTTRIPKRRRARIVQGLIFCILLALCLATSAQADTVYQYTGNAYQPAVCQGAYCSGGPYHLSITVDLSVTGSALDNLTQFGPIFLGNLSPFVTSFSFSDGMASLTDATSGQPGYFDVQTDSTGNIVLWDVHIQTLSGSVDFLWINDPGSPGLVEDASLLTGSTTSSAENMNDPGAWTMSTTTGPVPTPEPSSRWLLAIEILAFIGFLLRKKLRLRSAFPVQAS